MTLVPFGNKSVTFIVTDLMTPAQGPFVTGVSETYFCSGLNLEMFGLNHETFRLNLETFGLNLETFGLDLETFGLNQQILRLNR